MSVHRGGRNIYGASIGVVCLDSKFPKPPGHIKNPSGLSFAVLYETIPGATVPELINSPGAELLESFIAAAKRLEAEGVQAITGSCGFMALFQRELAEAVEVPVFASSLIQVPLMHELTGRKAPVGILTASRKNLTQAHLDAVGAGSVPVEVEGMEGQPEFTEVILENRCDSMDMQKIEREILAAGRSLVSRNPDIRSLVLECTDMPPYAHRLQSELGLPVADLTTLATMIHSILAREPYSGFMPY